MIDIPDIQVKLTPLLFYFVLLSKPPERDIIMRQPLFYTLLATPIRAPFATQPSPTPSTIQLEVASPPGQPVYKGDPGKFEIIGNTIVSAQQVGVDIILGLSLQLVLQIFLGRPDKVYLIDKVENNPAQINGHPVWASGLLLSIFFHQTVIKPKG